MAEGADRLVTGAVSGTSELDLLVSQGLFRMAFQTSPDAVNINRLKDGVYVDVNQGFCALTGWTREEVLGRPSLEIGIWADPEDRVRVVRQLQAQGFVQNLEARFRCKDRRVRRGLFSARVFELAGTQYILSVTRDIEDWKEARAGYATFRALVEASTDFVSMSTLDARIVYLNRAGARMVGLDDPADALRLSVPDFMAEGPGENALDDLLKELRNPGYAKGTVRLRNFKGGEPVEVEYAIFPLPAGEIGTRDHMAVVARDVSERQRASRQLAANEARYRRIFENIVDVYAETLPDGTILEISPSVLNVFGYPREDLVGRRRSTDLYEDPGARQEVFRRLETEGRVTDFEARFRHRDGHLAWCAVSARFVPDPDGGPPRVASLLRDISDRKRVEADRARLEEQLRETHRLESIGRLAGGVAHDFNNLLTPIIGYSEMLLAALPEDHPMRSSLDEIRAAGVRAREVTGQLLAFGRRQVLQVKIVDLNRLVREVQPMIARMAREEVRLEVEVEPQPLAVHADPSQVKMVLVNLAMNAQESLTAGGTVGIRTGRLTLDVGDPAHPGVAAGRWAVLAVSDTGQGMDAETQAHVFEPFFSSRNHGPGAGLGLATSYGVVKQHGGHLAVESSVGKGTTYRMYLPLVDPPVVDAEEPQVERPASTGGETILVVEDEPGVRGLVCSILESQGYRVIHAADAESALDLSDRYPGPVHLLLSDIILPGENGLQLCQRLVARRPGLRVMYMSGYPDDVIVRHGVLEAGVRFLPKPFAVADLTRRVREALDDRGP